MLVGVVFDGEDSASSRRLNLGANELVVDLCGSENIDMIVSIDMGIQPSP